MTKIYSRTITIHTPKTYTKNIHQKHAAKDIQRDNYGKQEQKRQNIQ